MGHIQEGLTESPAEAQWPPTVEGIGQRQPAAQLFRAHALTHSQSRPQGEDHKATAQGTDSFEDFPSDLSQGTHSASCMRLSSLSRSTP